MLLGSDFAKYGEFVCLLDRDDEVVSVDRDLIASDTFEKFAHVVPIHGDVQGCSDSVTSCDLVFELRTVGFPADDLDVFLGEGQTYVSKVCGRESGGCLAG